jgi:subtilisin family serine protease
MPGLHAAGSLRLCRSGRRRRADTQRLPARACAAIIDAVKGGARLVNLSISLLEISSSAEPQLREALNYAARSGSIIVVAAGNQSIIGNSALTRHPWVIPVVACDDSGRPLAISNLGASASTRGLSAPGENITSIGADGAASTISGTSAAAAFVTGTAALLWSQFPAVSASAIKMALVPSRTRRQRSLAPPLLNAWAAHRSLAASAPGA